MTDKFVAASNIKHFLRKLASETDEAKRKMLMTLLAEEESKVAALEDDIPDDKDKNKRG